MRTAACSLPSIIPEGGTGFSVMGWSSTLLGMRKNCEVNCELFLQHLGTVQ